MSDQKITFYISDTDPENGRLSISPHVSVDMSDEVTPSVQALLTLLATVVDTDVFAGLMEWAQTQNYNGVYEEITGLSSKSPPKEIEPELSELPYGEEDITIGDYVDGIIKQAQQGDDHDE